MVANNTLNKKGAERLLVCLPIRMECHRRTGFAAEAVVAVVAVVVAEAVAVGFAAVMDRAG